MDWAVGECRSKLLQMSEKRGKLCGLGCRGVSGVKLWDVVA